MDIEALFKQHVGNLYWYYDPSWVGIDNPIYTIYGLDRNKGYFLGHIVRGKWGGVGDVNIIIVPATGFIFFPVNE